MYNFLIFESDLKVLREEKVSLLFLFCIRTFLKVVNVISSFVFYFMLLLLLLLWLMWLLSLLLVWLIFLLLESFLPTTMKLLTLCANGPINFVKFFNGPSPASFSLFLFFFKHKFYRKTQYFSGIRGVYADHLTTTINVPKFCCWSSIPWYLNPLDHHNSPNVYLQVCRVTIIF